MLYGKFITGCLTVALLLGGCTKETEQKGTDPVTPDADDTRREVMMTLKNKLSVESVSSKASNATTATKAETLIATAAENAISTLDVYVFGATQENGDYTFLERFAYRANATGKLPQGATELQLNTTGTDGNETAALLKLKKGLFVKLYCIANDTTLIDPADDKTVKPADFTPITFTEGEGGNPKLATEGVPQESVFTTWHTRLLTATAKADTLATPLAMAGAYTTPIDLTSLDNAVRMQVGFRLTRLAARFDIDNKAGISRFTIETVSMGNGRRASGFFPIRVYGDLPKAQPDQLITYPVHAFYGDNANNGLCTGAFYAYPSPKDDKAFIILSGKYKVNETEMKKVSYQIPFTQQTADGNAAWFDIANNHRYTIAITKADAYHLDANIQVADWADDGSIQYTPDNKPGEIVVTIPDAFKGDSEYDEETKTVSMSLVDGSSITLSTTSNSAIDLTKTYAGGITSKLYDWMDIAEPVISTDPNGRLHYTYVITLKAGYKTGRYPRTTLRFNSLTDNSENTIFIEALAVPKPIETVQPPKAPNGTSDNPNSFDPELMEASVYRITGSRTQVKITCPDGVDMESKPDWLDVTQTSQTGAETVFDLVLNNRDIVVPGNQGTVVFHNKKKTNLKVNVNVTLLEAPVIPSYEAIGTDNIYTPTPDAGTTPDDIEIIIKKDNSATVKTNSMDGVSVKIDYPDGSPEWLTHNGTTATKAAGSPGGTTPVLRTGTMNKQQDIIFKPVESKLTGAKKATVTLKNTIGGKDLSFTMTPEMQAPVAAKGTTASVPVQDALKTDTKTITLYQLPGDSKDKSQMQIAVTSLGGSALTIEGNGATVSPAENTANEANYILKPALADGTDKATITLHAKNYTDKTKMTDYAVSVLRSDITGATTATLTAIKDQSVTFKNSSYEGFTIVPNATVWQPEGETGGAQWFNIPTTDFEAGENKVVTLTATAATATGTSQIRPTVITLKNKIVDGGDLKVTVTPVYTVPTLTTVGAADPTQNTLTAGAATSTLKMYQVANSKITIRAKAIGGTYFGNATSGITVSGGNTYKTENDYVVTIQAGTKSGSFKIYNKSNNALVQIVNVTATSAVMTATANTNLGVTLNGSVTPAVTSPEGFKASVNWGGGNAWFNLNKSDFANTDKNVKATVPSSLGNISIKQATITMTNKIRGGENKTFTITPTMGTPTLTKTAASIGGSLPTANGALANNAALTLYKKDGANSTMTVSATCYGGTKPVISGTGLSVNNNNTLTTNVTQAYTITSTVTSGSGKLIIYNSDNTKNVTLNITMKDGEIRLDKTNVALYPKTGQTATIKVTTATGVKSWSTTSWNSGGVSNWYSLPGTPSAGAQNMTLTAANQNATQKQATVTLVNNIAGCPNKTFTVTPDFKAPEAASTSMTLNAGQNANVPYIDLTGTCPGGSTISGPSWLTYNATNTAVATYSYRISLVPSKAGFPTSVPGNQTITITNKQNSSLKTTVTVNVTESNAWIANDLSGYDNASEQRVGTNGKTMTVAAYGMFVTPTLENYYNSTYCDNRKGGNTWLNTSKLASTTVTNNRRKYTFNVVVSRTEGSTPEYLYQYHEGSVKIKYGNTLVKEYKVIRGGSIYPYPPNNGEVPYYCCVQVGGLWWAPVNVGASYVYYENDWDIITASGFYYQWGRNIATNPGCTVFNGTTPVIDAENVYYTGANDNWTSNTSFKDLLWQNGVRDPCPDGFRIPTSDEIGVWKNASKEFIVDLGMKITGTNGMDLYLPITGYLHGSTTLQGKGATVGLWSSTMTGNNHALNYFATNGYLFEYHNDPRTLALPVRCVRK